MSVCTCFDCRQTTSREESRIVWLKAEQLERRLCRRCLQRRGLPLVPRFSEHKQ